MAGGEAVSGPDSSLPLRISGWPIPTAPAPKSVGAILAEHGLDPDSITLEHLVQAARSIRPRRRR